MREEILRIEGLNKTIGNDRILNNISFSLFQGETLALLGANGAGKTSLINILGGRSQSDSGRIYYREKKVLLHNPFDAKTLGIYISSDKKRILDNLTVAENITLGRERSFFLGKRACNKDAEQCLCDIGLANVAPSELAGNLSPSQKTLVELASIYTARPSVLIIDEPSCFNSNMDFSNLKKVIRNMNKSGISVIYITHNIDNALNISNRILILRSGVAAGTFEKSCCTKELLISSMVQGEQNKHFVKKNISHSPVLCVKHLYSKLLDDFNFEVNRGEILGIAGNSGSGKTELLEVLFGLRPYLSGSIILNDKPLRLSCPADAISNGIAYAPEDITTLGTIADMSVRENISLSSLKRISSFGWISSWSERLFVDSMLSAVGQTHIDQERTSSELSGGTLQKILIARCLSIRPTVLLLDEPTKSIDMTNRKALMDGLRNATQNGLTAVVASSDIAELIRICDRLLLIRNGSLKGEFTTDNNSQNLILSMMERNESTL